MSVAGEIAGGGGAVAAVAVERDADAGGTLLPSDVESASSSSSSSLAAGEEEGKMPPATEAAAVEEAGRRAPPPPADDAVDGERADPSERPPALPMTISSSSSSSSSGDDSIGIVAAPDAATNDAAANDVAAPTAMASANDGAAAAASAVVTAAEAAEARSFCKMSGLDCGGTAAIRRLLSSAADDGDDDEDDWDGEDPAAAGHPYPIGIGERAAAAAAGAAGAANKDGEGDISAAHEVTDDERDDDDDHDDPTMDEPMPQSDLSDPSRKIWVVTTAALPWRTGTSVNPLLRSLYLTRGRPRRSVGLVVPWLVDGTDRVKLYGNVVEGGFDDGEVGRGQQEAWIRNFAADKCGMPDEADALKILFYSAAYLDAFGSIFPTEDICALIPDADADVAILEEPEHLNWFRVPAPPVVVPSKPAREAAAVVGESGSTAASMDVDGGEARGGKGAAESEPNDAEEKNGTSPKAISERGGENDDEGKDGKNSAAEKRTNNGDEDGGEGSDGGAGGGREKNANQNPQLGWAHKFNFVVGVGHTNYAAYVKQYGIGTSIIAAPAITAFNSLVVRAYCHRVVKLSAVLQSFAPGKEVTCNVHGVRGDFLKWPKSDSSGDKRREGPGSIIGDCCHVDDDDQDCARVYFIGKLLWAKGFGSMLEILERYKKKTGGFFCIDVYGGGPDEKAITRAFHGRNRTLDSRKASSVSDGSENPADATGDAANAQAGESAPSGVFSSPDSLRKQSLELLRKQQLYQQRHANDDARQYKNLGFEITLDGTMSTPDVQYIMERASYDDVFAAESSDPLSILGDVSGKSIDTGIATSKAVYKVGDTAIKNVLSLVFSSEEKQEEAGDEKALSTASSFVFDPPQSRFELRRHPIPARFLGVMDHALVKDMPHKVFFNPSISEVLCTTTAEALAMGKFAVIPRHPSNTFFEQFPNCLMYDTLDEAVERLEFAIANEPQPLTEGKVRIFTWEAATERLINACIITKTEAYERSKNRLDKADDRMAWLHTETAKTTQLIGNLLPGSRKESGGGEKALAEQRGSDQGEPKNDADEANGSKEE